MSNTYDWAGGREHIARFGPATGPVVVLALPLFEEANRTRTFAAGLLRRLAERGIGGALPDLPGQGESLVATEHAMLGGWRAAFAAAVASIGCPVHSVTMRGGSLVDHDAAVFSRWQLAPAKGEALIRELFRTAQAAGEPVEIDLNAWNDEGGPVTIAGNRIGRPLLRDINAADCVRDGKVRVVRLDTDPAVADRKVEGAPLWRRSEPGDDPALAALLADDIAGWIAQCAQLIAFPCEGDTLVGTLDDAAGSTGLLIVSGGNEIRCGAHRGMALLAAELAAGGTPVFRFDRRGIGESEGANHGWEDSAPDISAAATAFRTVAPQVRRIVGFGNCDAATALALFHREAGIDSLVLANPWVGDEEDGLPPAEAIRSHYADRMKDPRQWLRLATGGINIGKAIKGLRKASVASSEPGNPIADRMAVTLIDTPHTFLLANRDNTAIRFASAWPHGGDKRECPTDSHSFARLGDAAWLAAQLREALR